ncbi:MAG: hypothetical protein O3B31_01895 [Chloroflexi bacterium]|nr:hypothetical protein [Chloroflexota bacterium]
MARPPVDPAWRERVRSLAANGPSLTATAIARRLDTPEEIKAVGRNDPPHRTTVQRLLDDFPPEERRLYQYVRWPASFGAADLPWEAAGPVLKLCDHLDERATVARARWFWRITLAAPGADIASRDAAARQLHAWELLERPEPPEDLEAWLMFAPWESKRAEQRYAEAIRIGDVHRFATGAAGLRGWVAHTGAFGDGTTDAQRAEALRAIEPKTPAALIDAVVDILRDKHRGADDGA